jgi:hypothetical protein
MYSMMGTLLKFNEISRMVRGLFCIALACSSACLTGEFKGMGVVGVMKTGGGGAIGCRNEEGEFSV